jgi:hypothetical protein
VHEAPGAGTRCEARRLRSHCPLPTAEIMLVKQLQENQEIRHKLVLAENQVRRMAIRRAETMADQERANDLQRRLMSAEAQDWQSASQIHDVLVQAECRVHAAEEAPEQFAIESVNMYHHALRNAAAGQEAVVMAETSEYNRLEPRGCLNT